MILSVPGLAFACLEREFLFLTWKIITGIQFAPMLVTCFLLKESL